MSISIRSYDPNIWESSRSSPPDWWSDNVNNLVKRCPGMIGYFRSGITINSPYDFKFEILNGKLICWNNNAEFRIRTHQFNQIGKPHLDQEFCILKFDIDILFKCDTNDNYSGMFLPADNLNPYWNQICAYQPITDHYQPVVINSIFRSGNYFIKKGEPMGKMLFYQNESIDINSDITDEETFHKDIVMYQKVLNSMDPHTGDLYNKDKKSMACPIRKK